MEALSLFNDVPLQTIFKDNFVLLHSRVPQTPIASVSSANFASGVYEAMRKKHFNNVYRTQSYAWPHLMHPSHSLLVVNGPRSGQTWCYLPTLCSHVYNRSVLQQGSSRQQGPMAIVLTAGSRQAEYVTKACMLMLKNICQHEQSSVVGAYVGQDNISIRISLNNGCGILVASPAQLAQLFKQNEFEKFFVPDTLQHIVIDDLHLICRQNKSLCNQLILQLFKLARDSNNKKQFVITSQFWIQDYMPKMLQLMYEPIIIFGDFLEAFVYARAELNIRFLASEHKQQIILEFLATRDYTERTVIFCANDSDVQILAEALEQANYDCLMYLQNADIEVQNNVKHWKSVLSTHQILICTDNCPELQIKNAKYLIHYTMSDSWSKFTMRFATMSKNYRNAITDKTPNEPVKNGLKSLVLLDERNNLQLPRLVEFLLQHNFDVDPKIIATARHCKSQISLTRSRNILCSNFVQFGDCDNSSCTARHAFNKDDMVPLRQSTDIPEYGVIKVDILKVYTPNHFAVRLREHRADNSTEWRTLPQSSRYFRMACNLTAYFLNPKNKIIHWPPVQQEICIVEMEMCYYRVRIIYVPEIEQKNIVQYNIKVLVQFMDLNTDEREYNALKLFVCPKEYQDVPATAINMRILGIVPCNNERLWLLRDTNLVDTALLKNITTQEQVHCPIEFSLVHTIFVRNVFALEYMPAVKLRAYRINVKQLIFDKKIGILDCKIAEKLHTLLKAIPCVDADNIKRRTKLSELLFDVVFDEDIVDSSCNDVAEADEDHLNNGALRQNTFFNIKRRTKLSELLFDVVFDEDIIDSSCKGESWCELLINEPVKIDITQQNINWLAGFYVKPIKELHVKQFEKLQQLISAHINSEYSIRISDIEECQLEENYLIKNNLEYFMRAKLLSFVANKYYRFWLYDYASEYKIILTDDIPYDNNIFKCPRNLTHALPYQSIYCKLADINTNCKNITTEKKHLYAIAKRELEQDVNCTLNNLPIRKYEIQLYETDFETVDPVADGVLFNKRLNKLDVATENAVDKPVSAKSFLQALSNLNTLDEEEHEDAILFLKNLYGQQKCNNNNNNHNQNSMKKDKMSKLKKKEILNIENANNNSPIKLNSSTRYPQISWYQDLFTIKIFVTISDNTNYIVKCDERQLFYATTTQPFKESFRLHLRYSVQLESNKRCGLRVYIILRKKIFKLWPSLLETTETVGKNIKLPWLTYNLEHIDVPKSLSIRDPTHKNDDDNDEIYFKYTVKEEERKEEKQQSNDEFYELDLEYDDQNEYPLYY